MVFKGLEVLGHHGWEAVCQRETCSWKKLWLGNHVRTDHSYPVGLSVVIKMIITMTLMMTPVMMVMPMMMLSIELPARSRKQTDVLSPGKSCQHYHFTVCCVDICGNPKHVSFLCSHTGKV